MSGKLLAILFIFLCGCAAVLSVPSRQQLSASAAIRYETYARDTKISLEKMRNPETGLIRDKILISPEGKVEVINGNTSATNIALDLINQISNPDKGNIERTLAALEQMPFHQETGLIYSWYSTGKSLKPVNMDVSSVDNIHLALALWTLRETYPDSIGERAGRLFARMDFSAFYDEKNGLMKGNLKHLGGRWEAENYDFSNLGSEARSIYGLCWALGLIKKKADPDFVEKSVTALKAELFRDGDIEILRTWDGGAFQLLLPELLINESLYSPRLARSFRDYSRFIVREGERQGFLVPAAHSASNYGVDGSGDFPLVPVYQGKAGSPELVSTSHGEVREPASRELWDLVYTPHAAVLAATADPEKYVSILERSESLKSGMDVLYKPGFGFMDGYHVKGPYKGRVVPVQISLDQGMILLALEKIREGMGPSAKALRADPMVFARLRQFYGFLDEKLGRLK